MTDTAPNICGYCGEPAAGFATIGDQRYCHDGTGPTCYTLATRELAWGRNADAASQGLGLDLTRHPLTDLTPGRTMPHTSQ